MSEPDWNQRVLNSGSMTSGAVGLEAKPGHINTENSDDSNGSIKTTEMKPQKLRAGVGSELHGWSSSGERGEMRTHNCQNKLLRRTACCLVTCSLISSECTCNLKASIK